MRRNSMCRRYQPPPTGPRRIAAPGEAPPAAPPLASSGMPVVDGMLLEVGGMFHLTDNDAIAGALSRSGFEPDRSLIDRAHYAGAARFVTDYVGDLDWQYFWGEYLDAYVDVLGVPDAIRADALEHLSSEFASAGIWTRVIDGAKEALAALRATGARLGVVSNAD